MLKSQLDEIAILELAKSDDLAFNKVLMENREIATISISSNSGSLTEQQKADVEQEIPIIIYEAVNNYQPDRGMRFSTFVAKVAAWKCLKSKTKFKKDAEKYYNICQYEKDKEEHIEYQDGYYEELLSNFYEYVDSLNDRDQKIMKMRMNGDTLKEVSKHVDLSPEGVRLVQEKVRKNFKKKYKL